MISDKLYELAFAYKRTRLWESIWDTEIFAVKLSDGRIGYITVTGAASRHYSLGVYIGSKGLDSLRIMARADQTAASPLEFQEQVLQQECLQCSFESKEELSGAKGREEVCQGQQYKTGGKGRVSPVHQISKESLPMVSQGSGGSGHSVSGTGGGCCSGGNAGGKGSL